MSMKKQEKISVMIEIVSWSRYLAGISGLIPLNLSFMLASDNFALLGGVPALESLRLKLKSPSSGDDIFITDFWDLI